MVAVGLDKVGAKTLGPLRKDHWSHSQRTSSSASLKGPPKQLVQGLEQPYSPYVVRVPLDP